MAAESLFDPISKEAIRAAYAQLRIDGDRVEDWAARNGFSTKNVFNVLSGQRKAVRGDALQIAIRLGLRPDPAALIQTPAPSSPAGRTQGSGRGDATGQSIAGGRPDASCDRPPILQLGEAVR